MQFHRHPHNLLSFLSNSPTPRSRDCRNKTMFVLAFQPSRSLDGLDRWFLHTGDASWRRRCCAGTTTVSREVSVPWFGFVEENRGPELVACAIRHSKPAYIRIREPELDPVGDEKWSELSDPPSSYCETPVPLQIRDHSLFFTLEV